LHLLAVPGLPCLLRLPCLPGPACLPSWLAAWPSGCTAARPAIGAAALRLTPPPPPEPLLQLPAAAAAATTYCYYRTGQPPQRGHLLRPERRLLLPLLRGHRRECGQPLELRRRAAPGEEKRGSQPLPPLKLRLKRPKGRRARAAAA
jgi:hypothetical protein